MRKYRWLVAVVAVSAMAWVSTGCCSTCCKKGKMKSAMVAPQEICAKCGEIKGGAKCCQPGAEKCPMCGLDKGSPGCKAKCGG